MAAPFVPPTNLKSPVVGAAAIATVKLPEVFPPPMSKSTLPEAAPRDVWVWKLILPVFAPLADPVTMVMPPELPEVVFPVCTRMFPDPPVAVPVLIKRMPEAEPAPETSPEPTVRGDEAVAAAVWFLVRNHVADCPQRRLALHLS